MVAFHSSALDGVARNPALPTPLLLRLLAMEVDGDRPPREALQRAGLPESAFRVILAHPDPGVRIDFAMSARAEPALRARLAGDPSFRVRAALAYGPEVYAPRTKVAPLPDTVCVRLLDDPAPSVRTALLDSPHLASSFVASMATHHNSAARREAVREWENLPPGERSALLADSDPGVRRAAALQECRRDAHVTAELLRDSKSAAQALRRGLLVRADAERCVAERTHLAALAENPSLAADLVERLAVDPDETVRLAVSLRPELDETRRMAIDFTAGELDRGDGVQWVRDGLTDPEVLRRAATSAHPLLQRAAARSPHLPPDLLHLLARVEDPVVENLLGIHHPDTPEEVLMRVFARLGGTFSAWMAESHPRFPREGLAARYADHPDGNYRRLAVRDPAATPALIERLSHDPEVWTRQAAAGDPRLPLHRLREGLRIPELAFSSGANPALPEDKMASVLDRAGVPA
ncbi:adaptin domain-containing protein [Streptomyces longispororuber]|uniref:adaptin domain-containing protein n=1 Tax=Streptomyces longispororuber TaxID=68230 RepID=UPI00210CB415|nr:adaptin domain-containing protein [Streptomyces longispororuber]MCQ4211519.1 adaptin domain-containing protein [Streptomyces longispororuber]